MSEFEPKSLCILGRQPALGLAELESLYGAEHVRPLGGNALLDIPAEDINFRRLGGTVKTARILATMPYSDWRSVASYLKDKIPEHLKNLEEGKFTLGISVYSLNVRLNDLNKTNLELKKLIKAGGRPVRVVPNKSLELNSAQVLHNNLTRRGAWELLLVKNGNETILAQTLFVQDIEAYAARDQARPARDARVGMLPPKLAQIIINLATGKIEQNPENTERRHRIRVLDPFCGTGVVLQEAMLMGYSVIGTDLEPRMIEYTKRNLHWLVEKNPSLETQVVIEIGDAANYQWPGFSAVASEVFLGRPLAKLPAETELKQIIADANTITKKFLSNIGNQLKTGQRMCLAVPAWRRPDGRLVSLPVLDKLTDMGYNYSDLAHATHQDLIYYRADQTVARQLVILEKV